MSWRCMIAQSVGRATSQSQPLPTGWFGISIGSAVAQWVERATPGEEVLDSIPAVAARSPLVRSVSV